MLNLSSSSSAISLIYSANINEVASTYHVPNSVLGPKESKINMALVFVLTLW